MRLTRIPDCNTQHVYVRMDLIRVYKLFELVKKIIIIFINKKNNYINNS